MSRPTLTRNDRQSHINTVWDALHGYRETLIPEGEARYDDEWDDICTAMAWIREDLEGGEQCQRPES